MKTLFSSRSSAFGLLLASGLVLVPVVTHAGERRTVVQGPRGGVYQRQLSHTPGRSSVVGSVALPGGQTARRSLASTRTATGRTTSAQATGFGGGTATYDSTSTKTDTGYTRQATTVGPHGATTTKQVEVVRQGDTVNRTVTILPTPPNS